MDVKQAGTVIKTFCKSIVDSWFVIFTILGVAALVTSFFIPDPFISKILLSASSVIVLSGSFAAMTRWLSVHGIVKKELENILYGKEHLKESKVFGLVWDRLVTVSMEKYMPALIEYLHKDFLRVYLPADKELFYKEYHQSFDVYWEDKARRVIRIVESIEITICTNSPEEHDLPYLLEAEYPKEKQLSYAVETLKVGTQDFLGEVEHSQREEDGICFDRIHYNLRISGEREYRYFRKTRRLISLDYEPFIVLASSWHTYRPKVTVKCHDEDIKAYFTSTGTTRNFDTIDGRNNSHYMKEEYPELMMKKQGYSIYFASK